jgi:hypothetical protein
LESSATEKVPAHAKDGKHRRENLAAIEVPELLPDKPGTIRFVRRISTDKRAFVYRQSFTWTKMSAIAMAGVIHYYWLIKSAVIRPLAYGAIVAALLLRRLAGQFRRRPGALPNPSVESQPQELQT